MSYYDYYQPEAYVPSSDTFIDKDASVNEHIEQMRLSATKALFERRDVIIVASVSAIYGLGDPESYLKMVVHLDRGDKTDQSKLLKQLAELQYTRNDLDFKRGTFRVRGDVIDVFPADSDKDAIRIELFDSEIEQLNLFDPLTGEILQRLPRVTIFPKTHYVTPRQTILEMIDHVQEELKGRTEHFYANNKLIEAQRIQERTKFDVEMLRELGYCSGIENYSRYLSSRKPGEAPPTLIDYLPSDALMIIDESHVTVPQIGGMYKGDRSRKETLVEFGFRLPSALDNRPLRFDEFERLAPQTVFVSATPGKYEGEHAGPEHTVEQVVRPTGLIDPEVEIRPAGTQVDDLLSEIHHCISNGDRVLVTTLTKRLAEDLTEYYLEHQIKVKYLHSDIDTVERTEIIRELRLGEFDVLVGINLLREGLDMPEVALVAILDADKEGFLRSDRSLIQTIGRAARNVRGKAILYADKITGSMQRAMDETERRRAKQIQYNEARGIKPVTIKKAVADIMEGAYGKNSVRNKVYAGSTNSKLVNKGLSAKQQKQVYNTDLNAPDQVQKLIKQLESQMSEHAKNLEFEAAAEVRDQIKLLNEKLYGA